MLNSNKEYNPKVEYNPNLLGLTSRILPLVFLYTPYTWHLLFSRYFSKLSLISIYWTVKHNFQISGAYLKNALSVKTLKVGKFFSETANVLINTPPDRWQYSPARQLFSEIFLQCPTLFKLFATSRTTTSFQGILNIVTLQMLYTDKANILFWGYSVSMNLLTLPDLCSNEVLHFGFDGNYVVISHKMAILIQFFCCMRLN